MQRALAEAERAREHGEVPVGAVIVRRSEIIGSGHNRRELDGDPVAHAEMLAIHQAAKTIGGWRLTDCALYVTLEPCAHQGRTPPCTDAIIAAGIRRVVFGTRDPNPGVAGNGA